MFAWTHACLDCASNPCVILIASPAPPGSFREGKRLESFRPAKSGKTEERSKLGREGIGIARSSSWKDGTIVDSGERAAPRFFTWVSNGVSEICGSACWKK